MLTCELSDFTENPTLHRLFCFISFPMFVVCFIFFDNTDFFQWCSSSIPLCAQASSFHLIVFSHRVLCLFVFFFSTVCLFCFQQFFLQLLNKFPIGLVDQLTCVGLSPILRCTATIFVYLVYTDQFSCQCAFFYYHFP